MNLGIGRVQNVTGENIFLKDKSLYEFISSAEGKQYNALDYYCRTYYNKTNEKYFGQIITPINLLGLLQVDENEVVQKNNLLDQIFRSNDRRAVREYMNYFLCMWQFPIPSTKENYGRNRKIFKPYCILLKMLVEMQKINPIEAYLTTFDFCYLFLDDAINEMMAIEEIGTDYAQEIIRSRRLRKAKGLSQENGSLLYILNTLCESDLLTKNNSAYAYIDDFYIGLETKKSTLDLANYYVRTYKDVYFQFDTFLPSTDHYVLSKYGQHINNINKFELWRIAYMNISRINEFALYCEEIGYYFSNDVIRRFILSLETKPFLILTGISGSGKTKIAELWTKFLQSRNEAEGIQIAVGSNWTDNKKLLGFNNILLESSSSYQTTELVEMIRKANNHLNKDYIVILDEMNLSRVEMYFADLLSALEALAHEIKLPDGSTVYWSKNIKIIGTVNVDESTYMFSPKVLDRANVIEMNGVSPQEYINRVRDSDGKIYKELEKMSWYKDKYLPLLNNIYEAVHGEFAFRAIDEISQYMLINSSLYGDNDEMFYKFMDEQISQKILPKLHGAKAQLKPKLEKLSEIFSSEEKYYLVNTKIAKMLEDVKKGYASFIGD